MSKRCRLANEVLHGAGPLNRAGPRSFNSEQKNEKREHQLIKSRLARLRHHGRPLPDDAAVYLSAKSRTCAIEEWLAAIQGADERQRRHPRRHAPSVVSCAAWTTATSPPAAWTTGSSPRCRRCAARRWCRDYRAG